MKSDEQGYSAALSSPPFLQASGGTGMMASGPLSDPALISRHAAGNAAKHAYGESDGQLQSMPEGDINAAVGSPPFVDSLARETANKDERTDFAREQGISNAEHVSPIDMETAGKRNQPGWTDPGNIGGMKEGDIDATISSPPYSDSLTRGGNLVFRPGMGDIDHKDSLGKDEIYGANPENLGNMKGNDFDAAVSSPPFGGQSADGGYQMLGRYAEQGKLTVPQVGGDSKKSYPSWSKDRDTSYGHTDGQLADAEMKDAGLDVALSSPPYGDTAQSGGTKGLIEHGTGLTQGARAFTEYGEQPGQLGRMPTDDGKLDAALSSPPYAGTRIDGNGDEGSSNLRDADGNFLRGKEGWEVRKAMGDRYGQTEGQLGSLPEGDLSDAVASSPPFESTLSDRPSKAIVDSGLKMGASSMGDGYGKEEGNIGNDSGDDFWMASRKILENLYALLRPGGHAVFVVKAYVKNGKLENFPMKWARLCEAVGFELVHWHKAWVVENRGSQYDLFGNLIEKRVQRKSFFRLLAEKKGSPPIDFEEVLCFVKPEER